MEKGNPVAQLADKRGRRWYRWLQPPAPLVHNPDEVRFQPPLGRWNLYIGGAGTHVDGYVNLDLFPLDGVDVAASAEQLPFPDGVFTRIECDAVIEHTPNPRRLVAELVRCLAPGGHLHLVAPFCHPFHEYPRDYYRYTLDGLAELASPLEVVQTGWRTGPTATLLITILEYAKLWAPSRWLARVSYFVLGWLLFPLRYLDLLLFRSRNARQLGNHGYLWATKPPSAPERTAARSDSPAAE